VAKTCAVANAAVQTTGAN